RLAGGCAGSLRRAAARGRNHFVGVAGAAGTGASRRSHAGARRRDRRRGGAGRMKVRAAIIGSGNIRTDLLYKARRPSRVEPAWMAGIDAASDGLRRAAAAGVKTTAAGVEGILAHLERDGVRLAFDATSAHAHPENARKLQARGVTVIDLTPAAIGPYCVPPVNLRAHLGSRAKNVNMVSCGGQATIPMVAAVSRVHPPEYAETVAPAPPRPLAPARRQNIDESPRPPAGAVELVGGARRGKAIIIINPAEPPILMRDTIHCLTAGEPD